MIINLSPVRSDEHLELEVNGDTLIVNGLEYDFSPLEAGDELPASAIESSWFIENILRLSGEIHVTIRLPHGADASEEARFPIPITIKNGKVELPV